MFSLLIKTNFKRLFNTVLFVSLLCTFSKVYSEESIELIVGQEKTLHIKNVSQYSIANKKIATLKIPKDQKSIILSGHSSGTTTLTLAFKNGRKVTYFLNVFTLDPNEIANELKQLLTGIEGVKVKIVGTTVILDGTVNNEVDLKRINRIAEIFKNKLHNLVELDENYVARKKLIELELAFVEIKDQDAHKIGINWGSPFLQNTKSSASFSGDIVDGKSSNTTSYSVISDLIPTLNLMVEKGFAKIYDTNTLITESGEKAVYQAGGQINVPLTGTGAVKLEQVPYGTLIEITPKVDIHGNIHLKLDAEISSIDGSVEVLNVPSIVRNRIVTSVNIKNNESIALWGLITQVNAESIKGLPLLHHIPILGYFFKSDDYLKGKSKGIIFVTPKVVVAGSKDNISKIKSVVDDFEKEK